MLKAHLDAVEQSLLAISRVPANAGHTLHRGTPREAFIREFLTGHLSDRLAVGTGEILDASSQPRQRRNQHDLVIYRADYPRIDLGGNVIAFLAESVVATIEIKSLLTAEDLKAAVQSAATAKRLERNLVRSFSSGYVPPGIISYVLAYDGPARMETVRNWLRAAETEFGLNQTQLPATRVGRTALMSEGLDGVFILGRGTVLHDTAPIASLPDAALAANPAVRYELFDRQDGNLLLLFLLLTSLGSNVLGQWPNMGAYLRNQAFPFTGVV